MEETKEDILKRIFTYHPPIGNQTERYTAIRSAAVDFALYLNRLCPDSLELDYAIIKLQECVMFANAAIAINEVPPKEEKHDIKIVNREYIYTLPRSK